MDLLLPPTLSPGTPTALSEPAGGGRATSTAPRTEAQKGGTCPKPRENLDPVSPDASQRTPMGGLESLAAPACSSPAQCPSPAPGASRGPSVCLSTLSTRHLTVLSLCEASFTHHPFNPHNHPPRKVVLLPHFTAEEMEGQTLSTQPLCTLSLNKNTQLLRASFAQGFALIALSSLYSRGQKPHFTDRSTEA